MKSTAADRARYHSAIDAPVDRKIRQRDSRTRFELIANHVDLSGKTVLDLGCSGGFFALSAARMAKHVLAIDADAQMIDRDRAEASRLGIQNVEFRCARIDPALIRTLPKFDVVIFMSVLHHLLVASDVYDWNDVDGTKHIKELLSGIRELGQTYVFETGEPWEPDIGWSRRLRQVIGKQPRAWVLEHVFDGSYRRIDQLRGVGYQHWPFSWFAFLAHPATHIPGIRALMWQTGIHRSDFRMIYVGRRTG